MLYTPRVIIKFKDKLIDVKIPDTAKRFQTQLIKGTISGTNWAGLIARFKQITIEPLLTALSQARLLNLINIAKKLDSSYSVPASRLLTYFAVPCPPHISPEELVRLLSTWNAVETAYIGEGPAEDPRPDDESEIEKNNSGLKRTDTAYLRPAPAGIDAYYAWNHPGGDGGNNAGITLQLFDIESNWDTNHPDLKTAKTEWTNCGNRTVRNPSHGTKVLGIIIGADGDPDPPCNESSVGITPNLARTLLASYWKDQSTVDHCNAIAVAMDKLQYGDVLLLETQISILGSDDQPITDGNGNVLANLPVEYLPHNFDAIQLAIAAGIVVIEPAGNNKYDLGTLGQPWLKRSKKKEEDSGAIMVTAASPWYDGGTPDSPPDYIHLPMPLAGGNRSHNFGDRIDCYAWGEKIYTTAIDSYGNYEYGDFGDTSGASAIIAGAALAVQGMAEKKLGRRYAPRELRRILSDPATGTLVGFPSDPADKYKIGVMPDLKSICKKHLRL